MSQRCESLENSSRRRRPILRMGKPTAFGLSTTGSRSFHRGHDDGPRQEEQQANMRGSVPGTSASSAGARCSSAKFKRKRSVPMTSGRWIISCLRGPPPGRAQPGIRLWDRPGSTPPGPSRALASSGPGGNPQEYPILYPPNYPPGSRGGGESGRLPFPATLLRRATSVGATEPTDDFVVLVCGNEHPLFGTDFRKLCSYCRCHAVLTAD